MGMRVSVGAVRSWVVVLLGIAAWVVRYAVWWNEYEVHRVAVQGCEWPSVQGRGGAVRQQRPTSRKKRERVWDGEGEEEDEDVARVLVISDTHLLGPRGHWLDRMRREHAMARVYGEAVDALRPDAVIHMGDLTDEGSHSWDAPWAKVLRRAHAMFALPLPLDVPLHVVPGNHDVGPPGHNVNDWTHMRMQDRWERWEEEFGRTDAVFLVKGVPFVSVNAMALEVRGDGPKKRAWEDEGAGGRNRAKKGKSPVGPERFKPCDVTRTARYFLDTLHVAEVNGSRVDGFYPGRTAHARDVAALRASAARPILLTHMPLHRASDKKCDAGQADQVDDSKYGYRDEYIDGDDVLSGQVTRALLEAAVPRLVLSGHTHRHCRSPANRSSDPRRPEEVTVSTLSWRNRDDPSFVLLTASARIPDAAGVMVAKCPIWRESLVFQSYAQAGAVVVALLAAAVALPAWALRKDKVKPD